MGVFVDKVERVCVLVEKSHENNSDINKNEIGHKILLCINKGECNILGGRLCSVGSSNIEFDDKGWRGGVKS